jgi:hypothetical protein
MEFFDNMKRKYDSHRQHQRQSGSYESNSDPRRETDEEYNMRQKQRQEEIDTILDKIRKSGYDSLSKDEKKRLFEASHEQ